MTLRITTVTLQALESTLILMSTEDKYTDGSQELGVQEGYLRQKMEMLMVLYKFLYMYGMSVETWISV